MVALRRTDDGGRTMGDGRWGGPDTGGRRLNTCYGRRGGKKEKSREETGKMFGRARHSDKSWRRGEKEGTKIILYEKHRILKIGTESRGNHSLCSGLELHHPIMSKLWNLGGQTKREKVSKSWIPFLVQITYSHGKSSRILVKGGNLPQTVINLMKSCVCIHHNSKSYENLGSLANNSR